MSKKTLFLFLVIFISVKINAQKGQRPPAKDFTVSGKIIDNESKSPLEYATISFYHKKLDQIVGGGITDIKGQFNIVLKRPGIYDVIIDYISFKSLTLTQQKLLKDTSLGTIGMELDTESLEEVEIIAEKTTVELKLDKKIYNVGKDLAVRGGTVSDVLDNVPSVSVDVEGNVSLRGNENVRILINGKPSGLVGLNSTDALRQLPAESIEKVEVITAPSARYDAEGTAGILNIILRRSKLQGLNGALTTNIGYPKSYGISGNINYRTGNVNLFNTTGYRNSEFPGNSYTKTFYTNGAILEEIRDFNRERKGINTNFGLEWYINNTASLTTSFLYRDSDNKSNTTNQITEFDSNNIQTEDYIRVDPEEEKDKTLQYALNFDKQFNGSSEHKLTMDFQYEKSNENEFSLIKQDGILAEQVGTLEDQNRILLQADYTQTLNEGKDNLEFGYRGNFREQETDYSLGFFDANGLLTIDNNVSNILNYREYVNAAYLQYGKKFGEKLSTLFGLRMEDTQITIHQKSTAQLEKKKYTQLFPTLHLNYHFNEKQSITLAYNRRIRRPRSRFINPFPSRSSATNLFQGNPNLNPSTSHTVDLGYLNKMGKFTLNTSIYHTKASDVFTFVSLDTGDTVVLGNETLPVIKRTPINLNTNSRTGFEFTLSYRPNRKWYTNANFNLFNSETQGDFEGVDFGAKNLSWFFRLNNKITLFKKIDWQTRMFYGGPSEDAQNKRSGIFSTDLAFSLDVFKNKGSLAFNIRDLFNSRKRKLDSNTPTFVSTNEFQWRERSFNLSFTYRFNQKKKKQRQNRNGNGGDFEFEG